MRQNIQIENSLLIESVYILALPKIIFLGLSCRSCLSSTSSWLEEDYSLALMNLSSFCSLRLSEYQEPLVHSEEELQIWPPLWLWPSLVKHLAVLIWCRSHLQQWRSSKRLSPPRLGPSRNWSLYVLIQGTQCGQRTLFCPFPREDLLEQLVCPLDEHHLRGERVVGQPGSSLLIVRPPPCLSSTNPLVLDLSERLKLEEVEDLRGFLAGW